MELTAKSGGKVSFTYGPDGSRLKKTSASGTTLYLGADAERAPDGTWTRYVHPDAVKVGTTLTWLHRDHSQSIRLRNTAAGALSKRATPSGRNGAPTSVQLLLPLA